MVVLPKADAGPVSPKTILLVEDEALVAADEARLLREEGYAVVIAASGKKAIESVRARRDDIHLILMDIDLGKGMDGARAAREILKEHDIPIVFLSSHTEKAIVEKIEKITSYGYVVKDSGITVLAASIRMAFKLHRAHRELERHEEALRESRERFSNAFEFAAIGMALVSPEGRWLKVNRSLCGILGYSEEEMLARTFRDVTHPEDVEASLTAFRHLLAGDRSTYQMMKRYLHKGGGVIWVQLTISIVRNRKGVPPYIIAQIQDITERRRTEETLREMSEMFRLFMEHSPIYVFIKDADIRPVYLSRNYERLLGRPLSEILGRTMDKLFPSDLSKKMIADDLEILTEGKPVDDIIEVLAGRTYSTLKFPILIDGVPRYLAGYTIDITERAKAEEEIKSVQLLLKSSIESPQPMIILSIDKQHRYLYFNEWHREVMRAAYGQDVRIGMDLLECVTNDEDRRKARLNYDRALAGEAHSTIEEYGDLERLYYETFYSPITNERGEIIGATAIARDVTGRTRAEEALKESVRQKEILMKELQHRVKNSLAVVSGLLGLGMETLTDEPSKAVLADTRSRIRSIAALYEQLSGTADAAHVDLGRYIGRLAESLFDVYAPKTGNVRLRTDLGEVTLETKRAVPLGLILNELVMNSIKYAYPAGAAGEIRIKLEGSAGRIALRVEDDGPGLPEGFEPGATGGMGWSLIRMLAEELDARLAVEGRGGCRVSLNMESNED